MKLLLELLSLKRPCGTEQATYERFLEPLGGFTVFKDAKGSPMAYVKFNPCFDGSTSETLFSAHLDTVHADASLRTSLPVINQGIISSTDSTPLGADDGAGVWLLIQLINAGVPGTYCFTVAEECGGLGAKYLAKHHSDFLKEHKRAIAFDRRGLDSVITHQMYGRCCSDLFAGALSEALNRFDEELFYSPDSSGVYTDNAEWSGLIPECTNISCGYDHEHSQYETLDTLHLERLLEACLKLDWEALPTKEPRRFLSYDEILTFVQEQDCDNIAEFIDNLQYEIEELQNEKY
jgi:hypothetical protein